MTYTEWRHKVACYCRTNDTAALDLIARRLADKERASVEPCNVWHEAYLYTRETRCWPACTLCGAPTDPRHGQAHDLCRALVARGLPTPPLADNSRCSCAHCQRGSA